MHHPVFIHEADGDDIIAFLQQTLRNIISARRILVARVANLLAVHIGEVLVEERTEQQSCRLSGMLLVDLHMLAKPCSTNAAPAPFILVDGLPVGIVKVCSGVERLLLVEHSVPPAVDKLVGTHLCPHVVIVLIEPRLLNEHRIVAP